MMPDFSQPGGDGRRVASDWPWQRGMVYTVGPETSSSVRCGHRYRITVTSKRFVSADPAFTGFANRFGRVDQIANARIARLKCARSHALKARIVDQGWRHLGGRREIASAYTTIDMACSGSAHLRPPGMQAPQPEALSTQLEINRRIGASSRQGSDEIFNEFDFADRAMPTAAPLIISYGERISTPFSVPSLTFAVHIQSADFAV